MMKVCCYIVVLMLGLGHSVLAFQTDRLFFEKVEAGNTSPHTSVFGITKDQYGFMWFGTWDGLYRYDGISFRVYRNEPADSTAIPSNRVRNIFMAADGTLWILGFNNLYASYDPNKDLFRRVARDRIPPGIADSLARSSNSANKNARLGHIRWYISGERLCQESMETGHKFFYETDIATPGTLTDDHVTWYYLDDHLILWVGTRSGDINKADLRRKPFYFSYNRLEENGKLKNSSIRTIFNDDENLWLAENYGGVSLVDNHTGERRFFEKLTPDARDLNRVRSIASDKKGNIWIGSTSGLHQYDRLSRKLRQFDLAALFPELLIPSVFSVEQDRYGAIWAGLYNGLAHYDAKTDKLNVFMLADLIGDHSVMKLLVDRNSHIWLATEGNGIICLKRETLGEQWNDTLVLKHEVDKEHSLPGDMVYALFEDSEGIIWAGTSTGLCSIDPSSGKVQRLTRESGLRDEYISCILGDDRGNIWISHKKGLARLNKQTGQVRHFSSFQGNRDLIFLDNAGYWDADNQTMYFGAKDGYLSFKPDEIIDNPVPPKVVFTRLQIQNKTVGIKDGVGGRPILKEALLHAKSITLSYWERSFSIAFAALHYAEPASNQYAFKLDGFDEDWILTDASRAVAGYSNLPAGNYTLKVKAANPDGIWSEKTVDLQIKIKPPFWATFWAYLIYGLLSLLFLTLLYYYLIARVRLKNQLEVERLKMAQALEMENMKLEFCTNVSHELRTPLSLIIDPLENLKSGSVPSGKEASYYEMMLRNARRLLELINQLLDFRKIETGNEVVSFTRVNWSEVAQNIVDSFAVQASRRSVRLNFRSYPKSISCAMDADKFEKILVNLVSNATKYTPNGGTVDVELKFKQAEMQIPGKMTLIVRDSGIGIPPESLPTIFDPFCRVKEHKPFEGHSSGIGLALTKKMVELLGGSIRVDSKPGKGSQFRVTLPVSSAEFKTGVEAVPGDKKLTEETSVKPDSAKPILLVVDDNADIRSYLTGEFLDEYMIETAADGQEGLAKARELVPDLVISDVMMPVMDGMEFCREMKTDVRTSHVPVVLLTSHQSQGSQLEGLENGADAFVTKPFNSLVLRAQMNSLIENRRILQARYGESLSDDASLLPGNRMDHTFLQKATDLVRDNLTTEGFNSDFLADALNMSQRQLYRKMNALTGQTVHQFITSIRLNSAKELLLTTELSISEVAYRVGYTEPSNFSRSFSKQFGQSPSQYLVVKKHKS